MIWFWVGPEASLDRRSPVSGITMKDRCTPCVVDPSFEINLRGEARVETVQLISCCVRRGRFGQYPNRDG